jgi:hypothetical protein
MPNRLEQLKSCSFITYSRNILAGCLEVVVRFINHPMQVRDCILNIEMFILSRSALRGKQRASMHFLEVTVRKFVPLLGVPALLVVDCQMPLRVRVESIGTNELVFFVRRGLVFTPRISFVKDYFPLLDHLFRMLECCLV